MNEFVFDFTWSSASLIVLGAAIAALVAGQVTDAVMRDRGFGQIGNGLLLLLGAGVGLYARHVFVGPLPVSDAQATVILAGGSAIAMLVLFGLLKRLVER